MFIQCFHTVNQLRLIRIFVYIVCIRDDPILRRPNIIIRVDHFYQYSFLFILSLVMRIRRIQLHMHDFVWRSARESNPEVPTRNIFFRHFTWTFRRRFSARKPHFRHFSTISRKTSNKSQICD